MTRNRGATSLARPAGVAAVLLLVLATVGAPALAHTGDDGTHHHDGSMGMHDGAGWWAGSGFGLAWMLLGAVGLLALPLVFGYVLLTRQRSAKGDPDDALAVLRRRYASGEIDDEEFETRRGKLSREQN
jgi:putative membrane protein